ncbi:MAG: hypothetical protein WC273_04410 [Dehalococcoidia bacterium]
MWRHVRETTLRRNRPLEDGDPRRRLLAAAFHQLAGTARAVVYEVPHPLRPRAVTGSIFPRSTAPWRGFLDAREAVDTGEPTVLVSLRVLDDEERHLAVDWGTTYPNTFLLVEPHDYRCDLSDPDNPFARRLAATVDALAVAPGRGARPRAPGRSPLDRLLREMFGTWRYWPATERSGMTRGRRLELRDGRATIWSSLLPELVERFPQAAFDRALRRLLASDRELFAGPVPRARSVFRTRLGLPFLHDARYVDRAVRRLVNAGALSVVAAPPRRATFGPGRPVPDGIPEEDFERFVMI